jgi:hypothetical protein
MNNKGMFPVHYNGKKYNEKDCDQAFLAAYHCREALNDEGGVYMFDDVWIYPDGSTDEW